MGGATAAGKADSTTAPIAGFTPEGTASPACSAGAGANGGVGGVAVVLALATGALKDGVHGGKGMEVEHPASTKMLVPIAPAMRGLLNSGATSLVASGELGTCVISYSCTSSITLTVKPDKFVAMKGIAYCVLRIAYCVYGWAASLKAACIEVGHFLILIMQDDDQIR